MVCGRRREVVEVVAEEFAVDGFVVNGPSARCWWCWCWWVYVVAEEEEEDEGGTGPA